MDTLIIHPENEALESLDAEVIDNIKAGLNEVRLFKQGKLNTISADDFLNEL